MTLLALLNNRYTIAKDFTKKHFLDQLKTAIADYEIDNNVKNGVYNQHVKSKDELIEKVPYIFATHESMLASFFESMPDIITSGRSAKNQTKSNVLRALYEYLLDKLDLDEFLAQSAWWILLGGFVSGHCEYKIEVGEYVPQLDADDNPMMDEAGEPVNIPTYSYHDPIVIVPTMSQNVLWMLMK